MFTYPIMGGGPEVPVLEDWEVSSQSSGSLPNIDAPAGITAGELLIVYAAVQYSSTPPTISLSGWTKLGQAGNTNTDVFIAIFYKIATGSEGDAAVTTNNGNISSGYYLRISGVDQATPIHKSNFGTEDVATTSHTIEGNTTTTPACLGLYFLGAQGSDTNPFSVSGAGWSEVDDVGSNGTSTGGTGSCFGTKALDDAGASGTATVTSSVSDGSAYVQIAVAS